ncbi:hypothetical protein LZ198_00145 [Myxococcus sp. K15C18031901]|uniref:spermine/spermidine synthase domain-containing protein n=1 Tax=Myxococcus dinghuensis TaxID=2906761 RepID=UPI0020A72D4D|nr:hypothetical protein [Myxococcus dinghuensis]MCP3097275.1 hypothetical protein [Myxococcus dinghuensis]
MSLGFGLVAASMLTAQVVMSRLLAGTMTYYYAFMLISLAMLGLASGGLLAQLAHRFFTPERVLGHVAVLSLMAGISGFVGIMGILTLLPHVRFGGAFRVYAQEFWSLAGIFWCAFPLFLFGGLVVSLVLSHHRERFHRLYAVDLVSAALGCIAAVLLLELNTPVEVMLGTVVILPMLAAILFALAGGQRTTALAAVGLTLAFVLLGSFLTRIPAIARPPHVSWLGRPTVVSEWNSISSVRVHPTQFFTWSLSERYAGPKFKMLDLIIDGLGGTQIVQFDGKPESLSAYTYLEHDLTALAHKLVPPSGRQLIIGPGGGVDVLQAVRHGRKDITAVEINPLVARVVNEDLADFSGRPYYLPGVSLHIENGRTFIKRSTEKWDLITLTWVDTGGSATALAFSENYLYTVEAYQEFFQHLTPDGYMGFLRALGAGEVVRIDSMRGLTVAREALEKLGIQEPGKHMLVAAVASPHFPRPMCFVLVKRTPMTPADVAVARQHLDAMGFQALWLPDGSLDAASIPRTFASFERMIRDIITRPDPARLWEESPLDITPATDDNPFYFVEREGPAREAGTGVLELRSMVAILMALVIPFLLVPLFQLARRTGRMGMSGWASLGYFSLLGVAFMLVEMEFFHVFALVLGSPTITFATVLASMLVASGVGSLFAQRLSRARPAVTGGVFVALAVGLGAFLSIKGPVLESVVGMSLASRIAVSAALIAPLSFLMGLPMSLGMSLIGRRQDLVQWGWALNGVFSVMASAGAIYVAIHFGTAVTFGLGTACYLGAGVLAWVMRRTPLPDVEQAAPPPPLEPKAAQDSAAGGPVPFDPAA